MEERQHFLDSAHRKWSEVHEQSRGRAKPLFERLRVDLDEAAAQLRRAELPTAYDDSRLRGAYEQLVILQGIFEALPGTAGKAKKLPRLPERVPLLLCQGAVAPFAVLDWWLRSKRHHKAGVLCVAAGEFDSDAQAALTPRVVVDIYNSRFLGVRVTTKAKLAKPAAKLAAKLEGGGATAAIV